MPNPKHMAREESVPRMWQALKALICIQVLSAVAVPVLARLAGQVAGTVALGILAGLSVPVAILGCVTLVSTLRAEKGSVDRPLQGRVVLAAIWGVASVALSVAFLLPRPGAYFDGENPYSNKDELQCVVTFVVGRQFVVPGTAESDGVVIKAPEGAELRTPSPVPKPGLTFTGWRYAGVGDPDIEAGANIILDAAGTKNNAVTLFAQFVDEAGNAYCSCGAYEEGIFDGAAWQGMAGRWQIRGIACAMLVGIAMVAMAMFRRRGGGESVARHLAKPDRVEKVAKQDDDGVTGEKPVDNDVVGSDEPTSEEPDTGLDGNAHADVDMGIDA